MCVKQRGLGRRKEAGERDASVVVHGDCNQDCGASGPRLASSACDSMALRE